ncbi:MAG TPA: hypothetical protein VGQ44_20770 [Gemmatimonadaceae bacterium]|nr:hypothetical protein [Gemmatimonadaceae bacterium]
MRSVRCEVCGTKALMAASQCPKCSHLFEMRDGFGELLPLAFCSSCQSYYPAHVGSCKWCGTLPEPVRKPLPWTHISLGGFIAMALLGGVLLRDPQGKTHARKAAQTRARAQSKKAAADDTVIQVVASAAADTAVTHDTIAAWTNIDPPAPAPASAPAAASDVPTAMPPEPVVQSGARIGRSVRETTSPIGAPLVSQPAVAVSPQSVAPPTAYPSAPSTRRSTPTVYAPAPRTYPAAPIMSRSQPYVPQTKSRMPASARSPSFVAKNWIIVRAGASPDAHIVASIGPESRVQLGEVRGTWRRIRSRDIVGWVDLRRAWFAEARGSNRSGGIASR